MLREFQHATQIASAHVVERHGVETGKTTGRLPSLGGLRCGRRRDCLALCPSGHWLALLRGRELWDWLRFDKRWNCPSDGSLSWPSIWTTLGSSAMLGSGGGGSDIARPLGPVDCRGVKCRGAVTWRAAPAPAGASAGAAGAAGVVDVADAPGAAAAGAAELPTTVD